MSSIKLNQRQLLFIAAGNIFLFLILFIHLNAEFFIFDDAHFITSNPNIDVFNLSKMLDLFKNSLIPIPYNIWGILGLVFGFESATPFKALNLTIHLINSNLVGYFCFLFIKSVEPEITRDKKNIWIACTASALIYYLHPTQAETISWASCLKDVLSTFFSLVSLNYYLRNRLRSKSVKWLVLPLTLSLLTKPNTIAVLPLLCLIEIFIFKRKIPKYIVALTPLVIGFILVHLNRSFPIYSETVSTLLQGGITDKIILAVSAIGIYLQKSIYPIPIYFFTYNKEIITSSSYLFIYPLILGLSAIWYHFRIRKIYFLIYPLIFFVLLASPHTG